MSTAEYVAPFNQETPDVLRRLVAGAAVIALALGLAASCGQSPPEHGADPPYPSETDRVVHVDGPIRLLIPYSN